MKRSIVAAASTLLFAHAIGSAHANMLVNGSFEASDVGTNWNLFPNGTVPGWISNNNETEIDYSANTVGGNAYDGNQSLELNGTTFDTISQTVSGLTVGATYNLSWAYGERPGSGQQQMNVLFGGMLVKSDFDFADSNNSLGWTHESINLIASSASETLSFAAVNTASLGGNPSVGNEVDAVSLNAVNSPASPTSAVPEPISIALLGAGLLGMAIIKRIKPGANRTVIPVTR